MSRTFPSLQRDVAIPGGGIWVKTDGFINSVEATLEAGATSATIDIYVSNSSHGTGVKIATLTLTTTQTSDGFSLPKEDQGWAFMRSSVTEVTGQVKSVTACVGE